MDGLPKGGVADADGHAEGGFVGEPAVADGVGGVVKGEVEGGDGGVAEVLVEGGCEVLVEVWAVCRLM